jgi:CBS-domain-containing membrane protein
MALLYKFLEETAGNYMTRTVTTVTRGMTVRELSDMFERDDFNTYPVQEEAEAVGIVTKFDLLKCFCLHAQPDGPTLRRFDEPDRRRRDDTGLHLRAFRYEIDAGAPAYGRAPYS